MRSAKAKLKIKGLVESRVAPEFEPDDPQDVFVTTKTGKQI